VSALKSNSEEPIVCNVCKVSQSIGNFYKHKTSSRGVRKVCKACHKDYSQVNKERIKQNGRIYREKNREEISRKKKAYRESHREEINKYLREYRHNGYNKRMQTDEVLVAKKAARRRLNYCISAGKIERPDSCEKCGVSCKPDGHHDDYSKPLDVVWLCKSCHGLERIGILRD
jgi:type II secretory ATPase GspE/PulE/Tfp pilus assembly ATPase PilB-like protein